MTDYPGQEGGTAIAEVLPGKQSPESKLPVPFDRDWKEKPSFPFCYSHKAADVIPHLEYKDRLMVGYRYWTSASKHRHGLSNIAFSFANLKTSETAQVDGATEASFDVTKSPALQAPKLRNYIYLSRMRK